MNAIDCKEITKSFKNTNALNQLSFSIKDKTITGLIGRNGAGKTTLLKIIAGFISSTSGDIRVFGENPFNNLKTSANMIFIDDEISFPTSLYLPDILESAAQFYENWDMKLSQRLFEYFSFHPKQRHSNLSKGMKNTFNMIVGLSARCPLTIFDEPTTGMDAAVRKDFYRALLKDYLEHPRTIILSSHLLNEIEDLLEDILLINEGKKQLHLSVSELKTFAVGISGKSDNVQQWTDNKEILYTKLIGMDQSYVVVKKDFPDELLQQATSLGLEITSVATDDLCVYLTSKTKGGIDDVFDRG
jgi:ABC-2 type transport system ATP-binding protein